MLTVLAYMAHRPYPRYHLGVVYYTVTVLSRKDIIVQAPEDSSWYAESMKTAGIVNTGIGRWLGLGG